MPDTKSIFGDPVPIGQPAAPVASAEPDWASDPSLDTPQVARAAQLAPGASEVPCAYLCGKAGSGKSFEIVRRCNADSRYGMLTATTGIAAVNIGATTLNSVLRYFDTASMRDAFLSGHLARTLHDIALEYEWLIVEEISMMDGRQLDILYRAIAEANRYADVPRPMGLLVVGDFAQLPPIKAPWAFEADCWRHFATATTRLDTNWRQGDGPFLDALNAAREGRGSDAAHLLTVAGLRWETALATEFDGTTILPKNAMVSRYNDIALDRVAGSRFALSSRRWGAQRKEWGENSRTHEWGIPVASEYKIGAYVMVLANAPDFSVVNGDCGHIREWDEDVVTVELIRTGATVEITPIVREVSETGRPDGWDGITVSKGEDVGAYTPRRHYRAKARRYVTGQIEFFPLRLAYASTVHKAQGLTLDRVQVDIRDHFFGSAAMAYTALSRCRTLAGLRVVGQRERFAQQVNVDPKIRPWI